MEIHQINIYIYIYTVKKYKLHQYNTYKHVYCLNCIKIFKKIIDNKEISNTI